MQSYTVELYTNVRLTMCQVGSVAREFVYSAAELRAVLLSYGRIMAQIVRRLHQDWVSLRAYSCLSGVLVGQMTWTWSPDAGLFLPHDEPWIAFDLRTVTHPPPPSAVA